MNALRSILLVLLAAAVWACNAGNPPPAESEADYATQIQLALGALDETYRNQPNKPIPPEKMNESLPPKYFPPDPDYVVPAALKPATQPTVVEMPTSTGKVRQQQRV